MTKEERKARRDQKVREFRNFLRRNGACQEAREWCKGKTVCEAWATTDRVDWMLWLIKKLDTDGRFDDRCAGYCWFCWPEIHGPADIRKQYPLPKRIPFEKKPGQS